MIKGPAAVKHCGMIDSHAEVFRTVAATNNCVIASRALNPLCESLLKEGHASKGFYIKAKSCDWGPMAGMVLENPLFSKEDPGKQKKYVDSAKEKGVGTRHVCLSSARLEELKNLGKINMKPHAPTDNVIDMTAMSPRGISAEFRVKKVGGEEPLWQLFEVAAGKESPVMGLVNKVVPAAGVQPGGPRGVVAGDYDLFCVWSRHENLRALGSAPRALKGTVSLPYINAVRDANSAGGKFDTSKEDHDMGNVSYYAITIIKKLNEGIIGVGGYKGGSMIHHNDESGNPFTPGEDYPLIFFVPGQEPKSIDNAQDLAATYKECEDLGFVVERNPGFAVT